MLSHASEEKFRLDPTIPSKIKMFGEWNINSFGNILDYGCYISPDESYVEGTGYDYGKSNIFFEGEGFDRTYSGSSGEDVLSVSSTTGIVAGMRVQSNYIPADTVVLSVNSVNSEVTISNNLISSATDEEVSFFEYDIEENLDRSRYTPLISIFQSNRPDPGIIHLVSNTRNPRAIIDLEKITVSNFGDLTGNVRDDRIYPFYKNTKYKYWNSIRKTLVGDIPTTVGSSNVNKEISYSSPFVIYDNSYHCNKVVIKTQKYQGYPTDFKIDILEDGSSDWTTIYEAVGSTALSSGKLEIFYDGTEWSLEESYVTSFLEDVSDTKLIRGIRFSVAKMSQQYIPLEVIEVSPRLYGDMSEYVIGFEKTQSLEADKNGIGVAGVMSTTGTVSISNTDLSFSSKNSDSIIQNMMYQGAEFRFYQSLDDIDVPLGTFYSVEWEEGSNYTITISLEDYLFFLKSINAPDINIANISGVETSVALLMLFDNLGITNYNFVRQSSDSQDDYVMDFFYCNYNQNLYDVLTEIANSAQYAIYVDVNNMITASTKERFYEAVDVASTDYWVVGSESWIESDAEYSYLNENYLANSISVSESLSYPITNITVQYAGNGIKKEPKSILSADIGIDSTTSTNLMFNASLVSRDLSYMVEELWSVDSTDTVGDTTLVAVTYIADIAETKSNELTTLLSEPISAANEEDAMRNVYSSIEDKSYFEIRLDPEYATLFLTSGKYSGHVLIDSELIKYKGLIVDVFDSKNFVGSGRNIIFNEQEYADLRSRVSSGSSILCKGLVVDFNFQVDEELTALTSGNKDYVFVSDGRGFNSTIIAGHIAEADSELIKNHFVTKLYDSSFNGTIKPIGTITAKPVTINDPRIDATYSKDSVAYPGHLLLSGPKGRWDKNQSANIGAVQGNLAEALPIDNMGERFITGFIKNVGFVPERVSTRMRLLAKPKLEYFTLGTSSEKYSEINRGIAGVGFRLKEESGGTTGYFLEIEDVGNITAEQIESAFYNNIRLYRVSKDANGKFVPKVLGANWVDVAAVASRTVDAGESFVNNGLSYTGTSDISVVIEKNAKNYIYTVYWENQKVIEVKESVKKAINKKSSTVGVMARSNSEAMFEHIMAASTNKNGDYAVSAMFSKGSPFMNIENATSRGLLPPGLSEILVSGAKVKSYFEDFGKTLREVRKISVPFDKPVVYAQLLSLKNLNPDYYVAQFSSSSYGADFWVFNTSNTSIALGTQSSTPLLVSGVAVNKIYSGETNLDEFIKNKLGDTNEMPSVISKNKEKYGENVLSLRGEYINSLSQANNLMQWIVNNHSAPKKIINIEMFPNPLLEIGDKVRIFYPEMGYSVAESSDKVYYIQSISYSIAENGPRMSISVREV